MNLPSWFYKNNVKRKSIKKEKKISRTLEIKRQPNSGSLFFAKADLSSDKYLVEHKYTDKKSFTLTKATVEKIEKEATQELKTPIIFLELQNKKLLIFQLKDIT